ncbi:hypothetical protein [Mucilaginibacter segetis]|uniref:Uncharacterized protein n=1 Tax=Mucilaginibacter segetis TaxID=2793071 RepID=A0A934UMU2_9SPHI|nr:hypothetical protein [Mucilaginibacter segetis]MBK0379375.1 hypothetical protein [Mucilaginibacter segetis]
MKITDLNGFDLEIDNLQLAIMQADDYRHYHHLNPEYHRIDEQLQKYWEDVYQKLLALVPT